MRNRLQLLLQAMLVLVASLLGIVTNYATSENDAPWLLHLLERVAIPAIGLLVVTMVVMQVIVHRLENPAPPPTDWPRDRVPYPGLDAFVEDEASSGRATTVHATAGELWSSASPGRPTGAASPPATTTAQ